jgi:hypothetical protein
VVHILLIYDRRAGKLVREPATYPTSESALEARFAMEDDLGNDPNIEIVAFDAASEEDLRRTHGRYFFSLDDLLSRVA